MERMVCVCLLSHPLYQGRRGLFLFALAYVNGHLPENHSIYPQINNLPSMQANRFDNPLANSKLD
jgi:hypothetical protein